MQEEQERGDIEEKETPMMIVPTDAGPPKILIIQIGGAHKKSKVHREIPEYTITEDDSDLVAERVQDRTDEEYEEVEKQRETIMNELTEVK